MSHARSNDIGLLTLLTMWISARLRAAMKPVCTAEQAAALVGRGGFPTGV